MRRATRVATRVGSRANATAPSSTAAPGCGGAITAGGAPARPLPAWWADTAVRTAGRDTRHERKGTKTGRMCARGEGWADALARMRKGDAPKPPTTTTALTGWPLPAAASSCDVTSAVTWGSKNQGRLRCFQSCTPNDVASRALVTVGVKMRRSSSAEKLSDSNAPSPSSLSSSEERRPVSE